MKWTTEKPTNPGWYWVKNLKGFRHITRISDGLLWDDGHGNMCRIEAMNGFRWAGPIPEPED